MIAEAICPTPQTAKPLSVAKAAVLLEQKLNRTDAAIAIRGVYRAVEANDRQALEYILEAITGIRAFGPLLATLNGVAERIVTLFLEFILEKVGEANELFEQAQHAQGLARVGRLNRAHAARRASRVWFPVAGLAAIERLVRADRLPDNVVRRLSPDQVAALKEEAKPATALLKILTAQPERHQCEEPQRRHISVLRPGKTARDQERYGSREKRESRQRAHQLARSTQPVNGKKKK